MAKEENKESGKDSPLTQRLKEKIENGKPITVQLDGKIGDRFIVWGYLVPFLQEFASLHNLPSQNLKIETRGGSLIPGKVDITLQAIQKLGKKGNIPHAFQLPHSIAELLGLPVSIVQKHLGEVPHPVNMSGKESGPMSEYDEATVQRRTQEIRQAIGNREFIVVVQTGSRLHNRWNNEQAEMLRDQIQQKRPQAVVLIVSDGAVEPTSQKDLTPYTSQVAQPTSVNEFSAYYRAADRIFTTDSFGSWLAAGNQGAKNGDFKLREGTFVVQYTDSDANRFAVPGAELVTAEAISPGQSGGVLANGKYEEYWQQMGVDTPTVGVSEADFQEMQSQIDQLL